jgi:phosphoenolpyruvate-protein kinase (PTS system EI component)
MSGDIKLEITAAVRGAVDTHDRAAIGAALRAVHPDELAVFFHSRLLADDEADVLCVGLPASPGAASGRIVLSADAAIAASDNGEHVILLRQETTPDDVLGMQNSAGLLTCRGGMVSHAAVVARGWGIPAVVGAADIIIDGNSITIGETVLQEGDVITIDGGSGNVYAGRLASTADEPPPELETLLRWADDVSAGHVEVRANADTDGDAAVGRRMGAQGIGLCRTEHMFLSAHRLPIMRRFILSDDTETEAAALAELEEIQTSDFESVLKEMDGLPVTIRLLDPPLHEFLPDLIDLTAREAAGELDDVGRGELKAVRRLREMNPMLGTRGVRLGFMRSGIYEMQVRALCRAASNLFERGLTPRVEVMIPLVVDTEELRIARSWVTDVLDEIGHPELASDVVTIGAMIETPRAALIAGTLAEHADFFSFGTNDLTQMTFAFSRDDVESRLLPAYQKLGILPANPFAVLDQEGVGELVRIACESARATKPRIKLGVCGEHAGDPGSADFLVRLGVDSVSCSPFRIPLARLGVAQALLNCGRVDINDVDFHDADSEAAAISTDVANDDTSHEDSTTGDTTIEDSAHENSTDEDLTNDNTTIEHSAIGDSFDDDATIDDLTNDDLTNDDTTIDTSDAGNASTDYESTIDEISEANERDALEVNEALVLHVLRLRGFVSSDGFVESLGLHPAPQLESLIELGQVRYVEKRDIYALLPPGRERHTSNLDADPESDPGDLAEPYRDFLDLNTALKALCTHWQMRGDEPNDHTDVEYDRQCIGELEQIQLAAEPVVQSLASTIPRLIRYQTRLRHSAELAAAGDPKMFTGVACGSFHDVWMELHEDLIVLQRIDRTEEQSF